jgi:hypothetical protein
MTPSKLVAIATIGSLVGHGTSRTEPCINFLVTTQMHKIYSEGCAIPRRTRVPRQPADAGTQGERFGCGGYLYRTHDRTP